eukprot:379001-Pyramimonas_sp.AAC.1
MRCLEPAAGPASRSRDVKESGGTLPDGWGCPRGAHPIPIALNGQTCQDSDEQLDDEDDVNSMEADMECASYQVSPSWVLPLMSAADRPVPGG